MAKWFAPNLSTKGRVMRALAGIITVLGGVWGWLYVSDWLGGAVILLGAFVLFEAVRGWCIVRACGIKTRQ